MPTVVGSGYTPAQRAGILISTVLGFAFDLYDVVILPYVMPSIGRSLKLTLGEVASITSITLIGSTLGGLLFGWLGDRIGRRATLQLTLVVFGIGAVLSAASQNYASLAVLRFITGIGLGGEWAAGMVLFNEVWNKNRRGLGSALVQGSAVLSTAGASVVGTWAIASYGDDWGWRIALLTGGAPLVLAVAVRMFIPESGVWLEFDRRRRAGLLSPSTQPATNTFVALLRPAHRRTFLTALAWMVSYMFFYYSIVTFMPTLMLQVMKTPPEAVRSVFLLASVVGGVSFIGMGWLNDRFGRRFGAVAPAIVWLGAAGALALYGHVGYAGSLLAWPFLWLYLAISIGNTSAGVIGPWLAELFPTELRATGSSAVYMIGRAVGSIAPLTVPLFASWTGSLLTGMLCATPGALLFLLISLLMRETAGREIGAVEDVVDADGQPTPVTAGAFAGTRS